jgi:hypothetical protein
LIDAVRAATEDRPARERAALASLSRGSGLLGLLL